jgi:hypothetical protein
MNMHLYSDEWLANKDQTKRSTGMPQTCQLPVARLVATVRDRERERESVCVGVFVLLTWWGELGVLCEVAVARRRG